MPGDMFGGFPALSLRAEEGKKREKTLRRGEYEERRSAETLAAEFSKRAKLALPINIDAEQVFHQDPDHEGEGASRCRSRPSRGSAS